MSRTSFALIITAGLIAIFVLLQLTNDDSRRIAAPVVVEPTPWLLFTPAHKSFEVLMPRHPRAMAHTVNNSINHSRRHYNLYVAEELDASLFIVQEVIFSNKEPGGLPFALVNEMIEETLASNPSNMLLFKEELQYKEYPAIKFSIENDNDLIVGMGFIDNEALYLLTRLSMKRNKNEKAFEYFIDNFKLRKSSHD